MAIDRSLIVIKIKYFFLFLALWINGWSLQAQRPESVQQSTKLPIVFHKKYDISFWGLEGFLHSFDSKKYGKIYNYLVNTLNIPSDAFYIPEKVSTEDLLKVHTQSYLNTLDYSSTLAKITEVSLLGYIPNFLLQSHLLDPMRYATQGTVMAASLALEHAWAINLSGGYHHAKAHNGEGFCVYADIPLACKVILEQHPEYKILIVDLDAHQGNGHEMICASDPRIAIMDMYNFHNYPHDLEAKKHITFDYPLKPYIEDEEYLLILKSALPAAINQLKPNLIIYNAGTDIFEKDRLGRLSISEQGIIERDAFVFITAQEFNIPVAMVLSGGYTAESASIISKSIENILKNVVHAIPMSSEHQSRRKIGQIVPTADLAKTRPAFQGTFDEQSFSWTNVSDVQNQLKAGMLVAVKDEDQFKYAVLSGGVQECYPSRFEVSFNQDMSDTFFISAYSILIFQ